MTDEKVETREFRKYSLVETWSPFGSSVRYPAMGADHPLPPEWHDMISNGYEDVEFSRAPWKDQVDCERRTASGREFQWVMVRGKINI